MFTNEILEREGINDQSEPGDDEQYFMATFLTTFKTKPAGPGTGRSTPNNLIAGLAGTIHLHNIPSQKGILNWGERENISDTVGLTVLPGMGEMTGQAADIEEDVANDDWLWDVMS